jgi:hypothetical protein
MSMRPVALAVVVAAAACGPEFAVIPRNGQARIDAQSPVGLTLTALAAQWDAYPDDLADYITPIAVELTNNGPYEVRVSYADFVLRDERGARFAAINPFTPAALSLGPGGLAAGPLVAARGGGGFGGHGMSRGGFRGGVAPRYGGGYRRGVRSYGGFGGWGGGWRGYHVYGGLRGYYGPGALYWGGPYWYAPGSWVFYWGPRYYPMGPSADVLQYALPEGVLEPGGHVNGFLYFQKATAASVRGLDLGWDMHEATRGTALGSTHVPLEIISR